MKQILCCLIVSFACLSVHAQAKYKFAESEIKFFSETPVEDISAVNTNAKGIVDFEGKSFIVRIPIDKFIFHNSLMQEHFNENYMETEKYPNAQFKGTFPETVELKTDGVYTVTAQGILTVHGVEAERKIACQITVENGSVSIKSSFNIRLEDHKIEIPSIVFQKIAEVVDVTVSGNLQKM